MSYVSNQTYADTAKTLLNGGVAILPTETVYGLAARADDVKAVSQIFSIKHRPASQTLPVCVFSRQQASQLAQLTPLAKSLMMAFWPGPLTLVLPVNATANLSAQVIAPDGTIALRVPDIGWREAFSNAGLPPLALTSANISGAPSPTAYSEIDSKIKTTVQASIDNGPCREGVASTIIKVTEHGCTLLREGAMTPESFAKFDINWTRA